MRAGARQTEREREIERMHLPYSGGNNFFFFLQVISLLKNQHSNTKFQSLNSRKHLDLYLVWAVSSNCQGGKIS